MKPFVVHCFPPSCYFLLLRNFGWELNEKWLLGRPWRWKDIMNIGKRMVFHSGIVI
jgi:hypothetical protein